jgi:hypothetical protein
LARQFLTLTHQNKDLLRLRIMGCKILLDLEKASWLTKLIADEREKITENFVDAVADLKKRQGESNDDFVGWEDLSQSVYSTGLLSFLKKRLRDDDYGRNTYDPDFARALAYVHFRRGFAFQRGEEIAYQHAHFRYLGYLSNRLSTERDAKLIKTIFEYRSQLAKHMGITGWNDADFEEAFNRSSYGDYLGTDEDDTSFNDPTIEPWRNAPLVEGELMGADALFSGGTSLPQNGSPVGIRAQDGSFTLLLLDSGVFTSSKKSSKVIVRAYGIVYNGIKAMTPLRIEIKDKSGEWVVLDIPHSGTSVRGIFNGQ